MRCLTGWILGGTALSTILALVVIPAFGGGAWQVKGTGAPMTWDTNTPVVYNLDLGSLGSLSNASADGLVGIGFATWDGVPLAEIDFSAGSDLPHDVNAAGTPASNPAHWANYWRNPSDGLSPVIYDEDGTILDSMFGIGARFDVLGVAGLDDDPNAVSPAITGASIVINGAFYDGAGMPGSPEDLTSEAALLGVIVHEVGHFCNLDHSVVNFDLVGDGDLENDFYVPSMSPLQADSEEQIASLNPDDEAALAALYPAAGFLASTVAYEGTVLDGTIPLQGVDVVVRRSRSAAGSGFQAERYYAYSGISGARFFPCNPGGTCPPPEPLPPAAGEWFVHGVEPDIDHRVCIEQIDRRLSVANGTFIGPLATPATVPGPEECWDLAENADPALDDPDDADFLTGPAGATLSPVNILLNWTPDPNTFADPLEPNDDWLSGTPVTVSGIPTTETIPGVIVPGDIDIYEVAIAEGETLSIDIEASEIGSALDPVIAVLDSDDTVIAILDDSMDPDSGIFTFDPAVELTAGPITAFKIGVSSYPDFDFDGVDQATQGGYWLSLERGEDFDGDGVPDTSDLCAHDPDDDADHDGICANEDNCPGVANSLQDDFDWDFVGDACDNCQMTPNSGQEDADGDGGGDVCDPCPLDPLNDDDGDGFCADVDNCPTLPNASENAPAKLNEDLLGGTGIGDPVLSPDGTIVVYVAEQDTAGVRELYAVPIDGGSPVKLNDLLTPGGDVDPDTILISPNGSRVVYRADQDVDERWEIYGANITGEGTPVKLNGTLHALGDVPGNTSGINVAIAPDSSYVVYRADQDADEIYELYTTVIFGGATDKLNDPLILNGDVDPGFRIDPSSALVVFSADAEIDSVHELFSAPIAGGGPVEPLSDEMVTGGSLSCTSSGCEFAIDSFGAKVVYLADQDTNDVFELYSTDITGGGTTKISDTLVAGGDVSINFVINDPGDTVYYRADLDTNDLFELYSAPIGSPGSTKISGPMTGGALGVTLFALAPDEGHLVYVADQETVGTKEIFSADPGGGGAVKLNSSSVPGGLVYGFEIASGSDHVLYRATHDDASIIELFISSIGGGGELKLNGPIAAGGGISAASFTPAGSRVVFRADLQASGQDLLYSVPVTGGAAPLLTGEPFEGSGVDLGFTIEPSSVRVVFVADQDDAGLDELYSAVIPDDADGDGIQSACDVCDGLSNPGQEDADGDGRGDHCDNCPGMINPGQEDLETAAGPDATCNTPDDHAQLYGTDGLCGTPDDQVGDGLGDACVEWVDVTPPVLEQAFGTKFGAAWADYDNDGDPDLYLTRFGTDVLIRNDGGGVFTDVTSAPLGVSTNSTGAAWGDYDNDESPDLYLGRFFASNQLFRNLSGGGFSDVTSAPINDASLALMVTWADYDLDGLLDLFLVNGNAQNRLYRNTGLGNFTDATPGTPLGGDPNASTSCAAWGDSDDDGDPDLYVASEAGSNRLYRNDGGGSFTDVTDSTLAGAGTSEGVAWGDYDNDGDLDLYIANMSQPNRLLRNEGGNLFTDVSASPISDAGTSIGVAWVDYDNDSFLDLVVTNMGGNSNRLYRNLDGTGAFQDVSTGPLGSPGVGRAVAAADHDGDGLVDLYLVNSSSPNRLIKNTSAPANHWLHVDLVGTVSNHSAIGARVAILLPSGDPRIREVTGGSGYLSQDSATVEFGLGDDTFVQNLIVWWPSGLTQVFSDVAADQRIEIVEEGPDYTPPVVWAVYPPSGSVDASISTNVLLVMNEPVDSATVSPAAVFVAKDGLKVPGTVSVTQDGHLVTFDPIGALAPDSDYVIQLNATGDGLRDMAGNPAIPFAAIFDTASSTASAPINAGDIGTTESGATLGGTNANDQSGFSNAVIGDINGDSLAEILIGAPNADNASLVDAGKATLVFGDPTLMTGGAVGDGVKYLGTSAGDFAGKSVSWAGDLNGDGHADFLIGAPGASAGGSDSGRTYLVFGDPNLALQPYVTVDLGSLAGCAVPTSCGISFEGEAKDDLSGSAVSYAGDVNGDGQPDIMIGAPGAGNGSLDGAGKVYLIYGPLSAPGTVQLSGIGTTTPGIIFQGETGGDNAGFSISRWEEYGVGAVDDLLIGAPGADVDDGNGGTITDAGYLYAIWGGTANLDSKAVSGLIDLARVADGTPSQVDGVVFLGLDPNGQIGRSVTGTVDLDNDGQPDIAVAGSAAAWIVSGDGPKRQTATTKLDKDTKGPSPGGLIRIVGVSDAISEFGATVYTPGTDGDPDGLTVGGGGDLNGDSFQDLIIGAGGVDAGGNADSGRVYVVYGSPAIPDGELFLSDVGTTVAGQRIDGFETGDELGRSTDGGMDVNGDGIADALLGAPFADSRPATPVDAGESYLLTLLPPDLVVGLGISHAGAITTLEWNPASLALRYNVYRGVLSTLRATGAVLTSNMTKVGCGVSTDADTDGRPDTTDTSIPSSGDGHFYLVTAANDRGEGPLGPLGGDPPRYNDDQCP